MKALGASTERSTELTQRHSGRPLSTERPEGFGNHRAGYKKGHCRRGRRCRHKGGIAGRTGSTIVA